MKLGNKMNILQANMHQIYEISKIKTDEKVTKRLQDLGIVPKSEVVLIQLSKESGVIVLKNSRLALATEILSQIEITEKKTRVQWIPGSFTVELKYFRSMPWYKAIFLSNFFNFTLVLFRTLWYNRVG